MCKGEDIRICELLQRRNSEGMKLLFENYFRPLVLWGATFLEHIGQAEDLVQDFFIKLWESGLAETLRPASLKSYLFTSVRNLALNAIEKKDPLKHASNIAYFERPWEEYDDFEEEIVKLVQEEIRKLPERTREVVTCVYLKGMRYKEVAQALNISVSTVNTLIVHALKKLRKAYGNGDALILFLALSSE